MVTDFWGVETRGAGLRACAASTNYGAGLIQGDVYTELEFDGARGWTDHLPWSHVEGGAGLRSCDARIQGIKAYSASGKKQGTRSSGRSPVV